MNESTVKQIVDIQKTLDAGSSSDKRGYGEFRSLVSLTNYIVCSIGVVISGIGILFIIKEMDKYNPNGDQVVYSILLLVGGIVLIMASLLQAHFFNAIADIADNSKEIRLAVSKMVRAELEG